MMVRGIPASPGYAIGRARVIRADTLPQSSARIEESSVSDELERLDEAMKRSEEDLLQLHAKWLRENREEEADIFEGHLFLLRDEELQALIRSKVIDELLSAESAVLQAAEEIAVRLSRLDDSYLRMRAADIRDVGNRTYRHLTNAGRFELSAVYESEILIAQDLLPSFTAQLDAAAVAGFATSLGGAASHTAIIARSLGLPAIVGVGDSLGQVMDGQLVILDGVAGTMVIHPPEDEIERYNRLRDSYYDKMNMLRSYIDRPTVTRDGQTVTLTTNIGSVKDALLAKQQGSEGIGLFRTEFLFMEREDLPDEEEQFRVYREVIDAVGPESPVIIRTMDIGGDKELPALNLPKEENPFLGFRAIRLSLEREDLFRTQLRAVLRASAFGNVSMMFPMIATLQEWERAKAVLRQASAELSEEGIPYNPAIEVGIMIEVPAAAMMAARFAKVVDFFSIGTNDLVQYTMAADRMNSKVAHLNDPMQPAVLKLIYDVIQAALAEGKPVGMCGEMAGQTLAVPILLGMGLRKFSIHGGAIASTRELISRIDISESRELVERVLEMDHPDAIKSHIEGWLTSRNSAV